MKSNVVISDKDILGGTPVFKGTRVPVQTLFDYLDGGNNIEEFLEGFPSVKKKQVHQVIRLFEKMLQDTISKNENSA